MNRPPSLRPRKGKSLTVQARHSHYDRDWQKLSQDILSSNPICHCSEAKVWNEECVVVVDLSLGTRTVAPAACVDHIRPVRCGGTDERDNLQALCWACHSVKTARYDPA